jgi:hypothetical protein
VNKLGVASLHHFPHLILAVHEPTEALSEEKASQDITLDAIPEPEVEISEVGPNNRLNHKRL